MQIELHAHGQSLSANLREYVGTTVSQALRRFSRRVQRVQVYLWDANGPRGGVDKGVRLIVELGSAGVVLVRDVAENFFVAVARAAGRARCAVWNRIQRRRDRRRRDRQDNNEQDQLTARRLEPLKLHTNSRRSKNERLNAHS